MAKNGCAGLISSNSINQGENRRSGLHHMIVKQGMELYDVTQEMVWPVSGANVVISITHFMNGNWTTQKYIDRLPVSHINSEFEDLEEHKEPIILKQNSNYHFEVQLFWAWVLRFLPNKEMNFSHEMKDMKNISSLILEVMS